MYRQTYFTILSGYEWNQGFPDRESEDEFYGELEKLFRCAGWEYKAADGCESAARAVTFRRVRTYGGNEYVEMSDGAYRTYLESRREEIEAAILEHFKMKRVNLYLSGEQAEIIARPFKVCRLEAVKAYQPDLSVLYVRELMEGMIADGRLAVAENRSGKGVGSVGALKPSQKKKSAGKIR